MIEFRQENLDTCFRAPGAEALREARSQIRWDPLTGRTMRVTAPRPMPPRHLLQLPELPAEALHRAGCPFCEDLDLVTPGFPVELAQGRRRLERGDVSLFPNLYPYGRHSAVVRLSSAHHLSVDEFDAERLRDALGLVRDFVSLVRRYDPDSRFASLTWNLLPPSGGTLVHPHWQVNLDPVPVNSLRQTIQACEAFAARAGRSYWGALVARERQEGLRVLGEIGPSTWLSPFAPEAHFEVWGLLPHRRDLSTLRDEEAGALVEGLVCTLRAYASIGRNALNMALEWDEGEGREPALRLRVMARSTYRAWYRSDRTHFHVALDESTTILAPESMASMFRPFFPQA